MPNFTKIGLTVWISIGYKYIYIYIVLYILDVSYALCRHHNQVVEIKCVRVSRMLVFKICPNIELNPKYYKKTKKNKFLLWDLTYITPKRYQ